MMPCSARGDYLFYDTAISHLKPPGSQAWLSGPLWRLIWLNNTSFWNWCCWVTGNLHTFHFANCKKTRLCLKQYKIIMMVWLAHPVHLCESDQDKNFEIHIWLIKLCESDQDNIWDTYLTKFKVSLSRKNCHFLSLFWMIDRLVPAELVHKQTLFSLPQTQQFVTR